MRQKWVKRMKALFLAGMMVFSLTACSSSSSSSTSEEEATTANEEESGNTDVLCTIFDTDEIYAVVTGVETSTEDYIGIETTFIVLTVEVENKLEDTDLDSDVNILVDEFVFTYIGNSTDGYYASVYDCTLPFYVENATTDYIFIEFTITAVNGTDVTESFLYETLTLDGDTCGYIEFDMDFDYELEAVGISNVSEIESVDIEIELTSSGSELPSGTATVTLELQ